MFVSCRKECREFIYETKSPQKLSRKLFVVKLMEKNLILFDDFLGEAMVDLSTICAGPVEHDLPLWNKDKFVGRIRMRVEMEEFAYPVLAVQNVSLLGVPALDPTSIKHENITYLRVRQSGREEFVKSRKVKTTTYTGKNEEYRDQQAAQWNSIDDIRMAGSMKVR